MMRVRYGLKVVTYSNGEVIIRQRIKILDEHGNLVKAPIIEVKEKKRHERESLDEVKKRAEKLLEQKLKEVIRK